MNIEQKKHFACELLELLGRVCGFRFQWVLSACSVLERSQSHLREILRILVLTYEYPANVQQIQIEIQDCMVSSLFSVHNIDSKSRLMQTRKHLKSLSKETMSLTALLPSDDCNYSGSHQCRVRSKRLSVLAHQQILIMIMS
jgi:hypothetical protein